MQKLERTVAHPLTGPVYVKGAEPGDLLEIEYLDIRPERYGGTRFAPGARIPTNAFMGTAGVAPSHASVISSPRRKRA